MPNPSDSHRDLSGVGLYDLNGVLLNVEADSDLLARMADVLLGPLAARRLAAIDWTLRLRSCDPHSEPLNPAMQLTASGPLPAGHEAHRYDAPDGMALEVPSQARLVMSFPERTAEVRWRDDSSRAACADCLTAALCELLATAGQYVIHAAAIAAPTGSGPQIALLVGRSGAGKTTTSLALHGEGWQLLTDDAAFVATDGGTPDVWGLPRPLKVHRNTVALLPELSDLIEGPPAKQEFALPYERVAGDFVGEALPVMAVIVLDERSASDHVLAPIDPTEAVCQLVERNVSARDGLRREMAAGAFGAISQAVAGAWAGCYRLSAGSDLHSLRQTLADELIKGSAGV